MKNKKLWPLALCLWLCLGVLTWAQVQVIGGGAVGAAGSGNGITGYFEDGAINTPSIAWASDADGTGTGLYRTGTNTIDFTNNGVNLYRWNANGMSIRSNTSGIFLGASSDTKINHGGAAGSLAINTGTTPTQSGTTCGTAPTLAGNNTLGSVTLGASPGLPCTIVFNGTWTNAPRCFLNPEVLTTASTTVRATTITTTGFIITSTAALVATDKVSWLCISS